MIDELQAIQRNSRSFCQWVLKSISQWERKIQYPPTCKGDSLVRGLEIPTIQFGSMPSISLRVCLVRRIGSREMEIKSISLGTSGKRKNGEIELSRYWFLCILISTRLLKKSISPIFISVFYCWDFKTKGYKNKRQVTITLSSHTFWNQISKP